MFVSQCLFCYHDNPQGAKFCNQCGSPLHLRPCWECNAINDAASETCYKCGAAYAAAPPPAVGETPPQEARAAASSPAAGDVSLPAVGDASPPLVGDPSLRGIGDASPHGIGAASLQGVGDTSVPAVGDASLPVEAGAPARDEPITGMIPGVADGGRAAPESRSRRRMAVALLALSLLGAVAIGSY